MENAIDTVWVAICAAMIFQMEGGFALLESGFLRRKNAMAIIVKVIVDICFGGLAFFLIGYGLMFGTSSGFLGMDIGYTLGLSPNANIPDSIFWFLQMGFAVAAISIISGGVAERMKIWAYIIYVFIFVAFIYPIAAGWIWNANGWLFVGFNGVGMNDFAGSAAVHAVGGWSALAAVMVLGARHGKYNADGSANAFPGHNLPLAAIGAFILWFGWFGFNPGSTLGAVGNWDIIGKVAMNTFLASAAGGIGTMVYTQLRYGAIDPSMVINGVLAGLVAITAGCNVMDPIFAVLTGLIAGVIVDIAVVTFDKMHIDDPVGAIAVHGVNGSFGTLAVGLFASKGGLFTTGEFTLLGVQAIGLIAVSVFAFSSSYLVMMAIKRTIGVRLAKKDEIIGADLAEYKTSAYSIFE
ncbi:MAG: ammonium transporter [Leptospirales bacterium]